MEVETIALTDPRKGQMPEKMALSIAEAAQLLSVSRPLVYELTGRADFPSFKVGSKVLVSTEGLREWVREQAGKEG